MRWNRRSGSVSAAGGRGTRGISRANKRRASRKNLELARRAKKIIRIKSETEVSVTLLKEARRAEMDQAMAAVAERSARLKVHKLQILADPGLRAIYALLKHPQAGKELGTMADGGRTVAGRISSTVSVSATPLVRVENISVLAIQITPDTLLQIRQQSDICLSQ